tara:strand:- start:437 stop:664 length:228 start_codon:yes stop_codon:yes gene_type:complete
MRGLNVKTPLFIVNFKKPLKAGNTVQNLTRTCDPQTNPRTTGSQDQKDTDDIPEILRLLLQKSDQNDQEDNEYSE